VQDSAMSEQPHKKTKTQLALAIAQGVPVAKWARATGVPRRTAFAWAKDPDVRKVVQASRRRVIDQAVGRMAKGTTEAADLILKIARTADTYAVQLRAARAVFSDMIKVSKYSDLEERMTGIETKLDQRDAAASGDVWNPGSTHHGYGGGAHVNP
jgi:hypothetical protein